MHINICKEAAQKYRYSCTAPATSGDFLPGKEIQKLRKLPCLGKCFHLLKPSQGVWTAWDCRGKKKNLLSIKSSLIMV